MESDSAEFATSPDVVDIRAFRYDIHKLQAGRQSQCRHPHRTDPGMPLCPKHQPRREDVQFVHQIGRQQRRSKLPAPFTEHTGQAFTPQRL